MNVSDKRILVWDHGFFLELAFRLARDVAKVYYCQPWEEAMSKMDKAIVGDGFDEIERVAEPWELIDKGLVDVVVFPDVHHAEMQLHIESLGIPVWGARKADALELKKVHFKEVQEKLGMNFAPYHVVVGLDTLREFCKDPENDDCWIKLSPQYRGHQETFHHADYQQSRGILDSMGVEFGPLQDILKFVVEKSIESELEGGLDTYTVLGKHPQVAVLGYEIKDHSYFAAVKRYDEIAKEITCVSDMLWPMLGELGCIQWISTEVKVTETKESILLEPTIRMPSPAGEEQMELYNNIAEIICAGASGELVEPVLEKDEEGDDCTYACEAMVEHTGDDEHWRGLEIPDEVRRWVKLYNLAKIGNTYAVGPGSDIIGAIVGIGDSPKAALDHLKEVKEAMKDQPVKIHIESLAEAIQEIETAQENGIHFSNLPMPKPEEVLES